MNYGIIALAPNNWRGQWVNRQQLFSRIGLRVPVVYSNGAWFSWDRVEPEWRQSPRFRGFRYVDNVWVDDRPRWPVRWRRMPIVDSAVLNYYSTRLRNKLASCGVEQSITYVFHPFFLEYAKRLKSDYLVYHAYDLFDHQPGWNSELDEAERWLLEHADIVITPSQALADALAEKVARPIRVLLNAADVPEFLQAANDPGLEPPDLAVIPRPRIGYVGSLHPQIDYGLIRQLAIEKPEYHWVLVGPRQREKDLTSDPDWTACLKLANIHMLGEKTRQEVPKYTAQMDVNVMIYRDSDASWTKVAYPLKVHEYLASGRPVVSMDLPMLRPLDNVIRFAKGKGEWLNALEEAIHGGGRSTASLRQSMAQGHSWDNRVDCLASWLNELTEK